MAKRTNTTTTTTKPAAKQAAAKPAAKQAPTVAPEGNEAETEAEGEGKVSQWAAEMARRAEGRGNACRRFDSLAFALAAAFEAAKGQPCTVTFAQANERAGLKRGETGDPVASWRLAVQRMRQAFGGADAFAQAFGFAVSVDPESKRLALEPAKAD